MSFQDELNNIISNEPKARKDQILKAHSNAEYDFNQIKAAIKFAVESKNYNTLQDGSHTLSVMVPPYPNTTGYVMAQEYLQIKTEFKDFRKHVKTGFLTSKTITYTDKMISCNIKDQELYNEYLSHLQDLGKKENINISVIASESGSKILSNGVAAIYKSVPSVLIPFGSKNVHSYKIRLYTSIKF